MFKKLKNRLFGFEKRLEEELSGQIEQELEQSRRGRDDMTPVEDRDEPEAVGAAEDVRAGEAVGAVEAEPEGPVEPVAGRPPERGALTEPERPRTYKEAKRMGAVEEAARRKESVEDRLERELRSAAQMQTAVEEAVGEGRVLLDEDTVEELLWELEVGLLESDVALPVIEAIKSSVREQLAVTGVPRQEPSLIVEAVLKTAIRQVLEGGRIDFDALIEQKLASGKRPVVIMFVGVNGTGKTTTIAKIAHRLRGRNVSCILAAGDTFRAGAIEQLTLHAERLGVKIVKHKAGSDPAAVAFDAIEHARSRNKDVVLLDTAGRMQTNTNLMDEMAKIKRVARPDLIIFVGDALAGNDAVEQAREFNRVVSIDATILTKVDADAKGGAALSVAYTIGKPLLFVGVGQEYEDQIPFDTEWMIDRLFSEQEVEAE